MTINLSTLATTKETFTVELKHPVTGDVLKDENGNVASITILGKSSKEYRDLNTVQNNKRFNQGVKAKRVEFDQETIQKDYAELLAAVTVGADNLEYGGQKNSDIDFLKLYTDPTLVWIKDQVSAELENVANFLAQ